MIYQYLLSARKAQKKLLAILLDPDKLNEDLLATSISRINNSTVDLILVGGSNVAENATGKLVSLLRKQTSLPIVLFPGHYSQITHHADAILFLSLISGRNPEYLINQQVKAVPLLQKTELEIIPTGYILIDGGKETAVQKVSETKPIAAENIEKITRTAIAGMYMGNKVIYLEAGSGALTPVPLSVVASVSQAVQIPLIVGGGIRTRKDLQNAYDQGADMVVIGTAFEEDGKFLNKFMKNEHIY